MPTARQTFAAAAALVAFTTIRLAAPIRTRPPEIGFALVTSVGCRAARGGVQAGRA